MFLDIANEKKKYETTRNVCFYIIITPHFSVYHVTADKLGKWLRL